MKAKTKAAQHKLYAQAVAQADAFNATSGSLAETMRQILGIEGDETIEDAARIETEYVAFAESVEYTGASKDAQATIRQAVLRIRSKAGYSKAKDGTVTVKAKTSKGAQHSVKGEVSKEVDKVNQLAKLEALRELFAAYAARIPKAGITAINDALDGLESLIS